MMLGRSLRLDIAERRRLPFVRLRESKDNAVKKKKKTIYRTEPEKRDERGREGGRRRNEICSSSPTSCRPVPLVRGLLTPQT